MIEFALLIFLFAILALIAIPLKYKYWLTLTLLSIFVGISSFVAIQALQSNEPIKYSILFFQSILFPTITIDGISALFILVINFTSVTGFLFAKSYLAPYFTKKEPIQFSIHYLSYLFLYLSMVFVTSFRDGFPFLIVWEIMGLSSFLLVIFDAEDRNTMKAGINYLIQMHVGFIFLLISFLILEIETGSASFDTLSIYFASHDNILLFGLLFIGFGIKAGFIPLHSWLPLAHPEAPSHVSGVMSGVMIKLGIYGILRVILSLNSHLLGIGTFLLIISIITGVVGILFATNQKDLKRLLAYSSIENIGIIGIGLALGLIGRAIQSPIIELLGFTGAILHIINHSLFKSLLFFNAGSVYKATHTRNIEMLGGVIKKMPYTAILFLMGALAICGLPPFNGFISEFLIYSSMFNSIGEISFYESGLVISGIIGLALIGGLALFTFTRAFGVVFLGTPRSEMVTHAKETDKSTLVLFSVIASLLLFIGIMPMVIIKPISNIVVNNTSLTIASLDYFETSNIATIGLVGGIFILLFTILFLWRRTHLKKMDLVKASPTWGCGYTAGTSKHQYTGSSFADNISTLANPILHSTKEMIPIEEDQIFPESRSFETKRDDVIRSLFIDRPIQLLLSLFKKIAVMQTGQIHHYILYAFVFMLIILILTFFNIL